MDDTQATITTTAVGEEAGLDGAPVDLATSAAGMGETPDTGAEEEAGSGAEVADRPAEAVEQAALLEAYRALAREAFPALPELAFSGGDFATLQRDLALARAAWEQGKAAGERAVPVLGGSASRLVDRGEGLRGEERIRHALARGG